MRGHVIVFAKEPRLGAVKTRLARDIGAAAALRFYEATLRATLAKLSGSARWQIWLAVTPDSFAQLARRRWRWLPKGVRVVGQGGGDLGVRMARAFARLPPGPAVLVGSDIPDIRARHVVEAFAALGRRDAVFGPAEDGGYWLVGQRRLAAIPGLFRDVRWSGPHALADTLANLDARHMHTLVARLSDVDDGAAYRRQRRR